MSQFIKEAEPFWEGLKQSELCIQRGKTSNQYVFPPRNTCPYDMGELEYVKVSGKGKVLSYSVVHRTGRTGLAELAPYALAVVELEEGATMLTILLDADLSEDLFDRKVEAVFEQVSPQIPLPFFRVLR